MSSGHEKIFKIVVVGASGVGKTSLLERVAFNHFDMRKAPTIGVDFLPYTATLLDGTKVTMHLWDTAGQERYAQLNSAYWRAADAVISVFDATSSYSLEAACQYLHKIYEDFGGARIDAKLHPVRVLVANKIDLPSGNITEDSQRVIASNPSGDSGPVSFYGRCSAMSGEGVEAIFQRIADKLIIAQFDRQAYANRDVLLSSGHLESTLNKCSC